MWNRFLEMDKQVFWGGLFGAISLAAILFLTATLGFSDDAIWSAIRDLSGTMVALMVFIIAIRSFIDNSPKTLKGQLEFALKKWGDDNNPLVFKVTGFIQEKDGYYEQGYSILQDQTEFFAKSIGMSDEDKESYSAYRSKKTGKFVDLPGVDEMFKKDFKVRFNFIESSYGDMAEKFVQETAKCLTGRFKEYKIAARPIDKRRFVVNVPRITEKEQIGHLIELLEFTLLLFAIQFSPISLRDAK